MSIAAAFLCLGMPLVLIGNVLRRREVLHARRDRRAIPTRRPRNRSTGGIEQGSLVTWLFRASMVFNGLAVLMFVLG